jgi:hypothetical protein
LIEKSVLLEGQDMPELMILPIYSQLPSNLQVIERLIE